MHYDSIQVYAQLSNDGKAKWVQSWDKNKVASLTTEYQQQVSDVQRTADLTVSKFFLAAEIWDLNKINPESAFGIDFERKQKVFDTLLQQAAKLYNYDQEVQRSDVDPILDRFKYVHCQGRSSSSSHEETTSLNSQRGADLKSLKDELECEIKVEFPQWLELKSLTLILKSGKVIHAKLHHMHSMLVFMITIDG